MKFQQKSILTLLIIGLISVIIIMYVSNNGSKEVQASSQPEKYKLLEIKSNSEDIDYKLYGQVSSEVETEVRMNVSGKIDIDNRSLIPGTSFKKNDVLIKVDRLKILYELLMTRSQYKIFLQEAIQEFPDQMLAKKDKWKNFEENVQRIQFLPPLPKVNSKEEEEYLTKIGLYTRYYKIKKIELEAENYIYVAPFDGVIVESNIRHGSMVKNNISLMRVSKLNSFIVKANIPINLIHRYENANQVYYVDSKLDTIGKGKFNRVVSKLSDSSTVEALFNIAPQNLKHLDQAVQILLPQKSHDNEVFLPKSAVRNDSIMLFESNKILAKSIQIIAVKDDSIAVRGLPNHCFIILQPGKRIE